MAFVKFLLIWLIWVKWLRPLKDQQIFCHLWIGPLVYITPNRAWPALSNGKWVLSLSLSAGGGSDIFHASPSSTSQFPFLGNRLTHIPSVSPLFLSHDEPWPHPVPLSCKTAGGAGADSSENSPLYHLKACTHKHSHFSASGSTCPLNCFCKPEEKVKTCNILYSECMC